MIKPKLYSVITGKSCEGAKFKGFHAPSDALTYDRVKGIGKKGEFDIVSFYDEKDCLSKRVSKFVDKKGNETLKIKVFSALDTITSEVVAINGKIKEYIIKNWDIGEAANELGCITERLVKKGGETKDFHEFAFFKKGQKPKKISYQAKWDGKAPDVHYTNIDEKLPSKGLEYMPLLVSQGAGPRHRHLSLVNLKKYDLEGVAQEAKRLEFSELNPEYTSYKEIADDDLVDLVYGFTEMDPPTGMVFVGDHVKSAEDLIRVYGHEYKHVSDLSHIMRLKFVADNWINMPQEDFNFLKKYEPEMYKFVMGSIKKGIIEKRGENADMYRYYKYLEKRINIPKYEKQVKFMQDQLHHPVEVGPIREGSNELEKFETVKMNIAKILNENGGHNLVD